MKHSQLLLLKERAQNGDPTARAEALAKLMDHIDELRILVDELSEGNRDKDLQSRVALAFGHLDSDDDSE